MIEIETSGDFQTMLDNDTQFRRNEPWTKKEDDLLIELTSMYGPKWTKITKSFTNRGVPDLAQRYARLKGNTLYMISRGQRSNQMQCRNPRNT